MTRDSATPRRGLVLGCGAAIGFAWTAVALDLVEQRLGWDAREADVIIGTSAGSETAAFLGAGVPASELREAVSGRPTDRRVTAHLLDDPGRLPHLPAPRLPGLGLTLSAVAGRGDALSALAGLLPRGTGDASRLRSLGDTLAGPDGWVEHPATWIVGADLRRGRRVAFGSPGAPEAALGEAIAASWGVPGVFPPQRIGGRDYADGGILSPTSADLLVGEVDEAIVLAPMSTAGGAPGRGLSRLERLVRTAMTRRVDREVAVLEASGIRVVRIEPSPAELEAMGPNFMDINRRPATVRVAGALLPARIDSALEALA